MIWRLATIVVASLCLIQGAISNDVNPCRRQPFRGRCPSLNGATPMRSQFVLRYYLRGGECVSYPYGHCANDDNEPKLFRYKEECEDSCIKSANSPTTLKPTEAAGSLLVDSGEEVVETDTQVPQSSGEITYATGGVSPAEATTGFYETPKTECQRQRDARGQGLIKGGFVPECSANGEFKQLQCEQDRSECFCVNVEGIEIDNSRTKAGEEKPDCERIIAAASQRTNECVGGSEPGPCRSSIPRWFYDESTQTCQQFSYTGCGGNGNNYPTQAACEHRCVPTKEAGKCHKGKEPLRTSQNQLVNCAKTECPAGYKCNVIQHSSVCCPDDEKSVVGVLHSGVGAAACELPKERGPCDRYELRFYFNKELNECKYFFYGGCEGNDNNFARVEDCEKTCGAIKSSSDSPPPQVPLVEEKQTRPVSTTTTTTERPTTTTTRATSTTTTTEVPTTTTPTTTTTTQAPRTPPIDFKNPERVWPNLPPPTTPKPEEPPRVEVRTFPPVVTPELPIDRCLHPVDEGSCGGQFVRWLWDNEKRKCVSFAYTGCGGNGNNFASMEECLSICHIEVAKPEPIPDEINPCESAVDAGDCSGSFMRYAFEPSTNECHQFQYGGCGGNGNNFATLSECRKHCVPQKGPELVPPTSATTALNTTLQITPAKNICDHPIEIGECSGIFHRFAYDGESNECRQFEYGGCGGNGNNFPTINECRLACIRVRCPPPPNCDTSRCQVVNDVRGCPFCSCPPPPQHPPIIPNFEPHPECPLLDVNLCVEPCIIFSNRRGCKECVCPVLPSQMPPISQTPSRPQTPPPPPPPAPEVSMPKSINKPQEPIIARPPAPQEPYRPAPRPVFVPHEPTFVPQQTSPPFIPRQSAAPPAPPAPIRAPSPPSPPAPPSHAPRITTNNLVIEGVANTDERPVPISPQRPRATIADLGEKCTQAVDPGPCKNFVERWHFSEERGECEPFQYGGCAGNRNHFFSRHECEVHCARFSRVPRPVIEIDEVMVETPRPTIVTHSSTTLPPQTQPPRIFTPPRTPPPAPIFVSTKLPVTQPPLTTQPPRQVETTVIPRITPTTTIRPVTSTVFVSYPPTTRLPLLVQSTVQYPPSVSTFLPRNHNWPPTSPNTFAPPPPMHFHQQFQQQQVPVHNQPHLDPFRQQFIAPPPAPTTTLPPLVTVPRHSEAPKIINRIDTVHTFAQPFNNQQNFNTNPPPTTTFVAETTKTQKVFQTSSTLQPQKVEVTTPPIVQQRQQIWTQQRTVSPKYFVEQTNFNPRFNKNIAPPQSPPVLLPQPPPAAPRMPTRTLSTSPSPPPQPLFVQTNTGFHAHTPPPTPPIFRPPMPSLPSSPNFASLPAPPRQPQRPIERPVPLQPIAQEPHFHVPTLPPKLPLPDVNRQFGQQTFNQGAFEKTTEQSSSFVSKNEYQPPQPPLRTDFNPYIPPQPPTREGYGSVQPNVAQRPINPQDQWPANTRKQAGGSYGMEEIKANHQVNPIVIQPLKPSTSPPVRPSPQPQPIAPPSPQPLPPAPTPVSSTSAPKRVEVTLTTTQETPIVPVFVESKPQPSEPRESVPQEVEAAEEPSPNSEYSSGPGGVKPTDNETPINFEHSSGPKPLPAAPETKQPEKASPQPLPTVATYAPVPETTPVASTSAPEKPAAKPVDVTEAPTAAPVQTKTQVPSSNYGDEAPGPQETLAVLEENNKASKEAGKSQPNANEYEIKDITATSARTPAAPAPSPPQLSEKQAANVNEYRVYGEKSNAQKAIEPPKSSSPESSTTTLGKTQIQLPAVIKKLEIIDGGSNNRFIGVGRKPIGLPENLMNGQIIDMGRNTIIINENNNSKDGDGNKGFRGEGREEVLVNGEQHHRVIEVVTTDVNNGERISNVQQPSIGRVAFVDSESAATENIPSQKIPVVTPIHVLSNVVEAARHLPSPVEIQTTTTIEVPIASIDVTIKKENVNKNNTEPVVSKTIVVEAIESEIKVPHLPVTEAPISTTRKLIRIQPIRATTESAKIEISTTEAATPVAPHEEEKIMTPQINGEIEEQHPHEMLEEVLIPHVFNSENIPEVPRTISLAENSSGNLPVVEAKPIKNIPEFEEIKHETITIEETVPNKPPTSFIPNEKQQKISTTFTHQSFATNETHAHSENESSHQFQIKEKIVTTNVQESNGNEQSVSVIKEAEIIVNQPTTLQPEPTSPSSVAPNVKQAPISQATSPASPSTIPPTHPPRVASFGPETITLPSPLPSPSRIPKPSSFEEEESDEENNIINEEFTDGPKTRPTTARIVETTEALPFEPLPAEVFTPRPIFRPNPTPPPTAAPNKPDEVTIFGPPQKPDVFDTEACVMPPDSGNCHNFVPRWFYNAERGSCQGFSYGSCGGNANNFLDKATCESKCAAPSVNLPQRCNYPKEEGVGNEYHPKWYFNNRNLRCEQMVYRGNGGNDNQFSSQGDCELSCKPVQGRFVPQPPPRKTHKETDKKQLPINSAHGSAQSGTYDGSPSPIVEIPERVPAASPHAPSGNAPSMIEPEAPSAAPSPAPVPSAPGRETYAPPTPMLRPDYEVPAPQPAAPATSAPTEVPTSSNNGEAESASRNIENNNHEVSIPSGVSTKYEKESEENSYNSGVNHEAGIGSKEDNKEAIEVETSNTVGEGNQEATNTATKEDGYKSTAESSVSPPAPARIVETNNEGPSAPVNNNVNNQENNNNYNAIPAEEKMKETPDSKLPMLGASPDATIDYANGKRLNNPKIEGIRNINVENTQLLPEELTDKDSESFKSIDAADSQEGDVEELERIPVCPNGIQAMQYDNGRPVMCLPGKNQCPVNSVCYFNGMDFFCCPNADDPYDQHIFGGYDGEEVKHGYKSVPTSLNIRAIRKRQAGLPPSAFSIDHITKPLRFDDKPVKQISRAGSIDALARLRVNPCTQDVQEGECNEAHLRYFYDIKTDTCRLFYYSGCGGNTNNFMTQNECNQRCKLGIVITTTEATVPPGRCPGGKMPLGDNAPVLCGNQTDSIGCPNGYYCRNGPPDVCCPEEVPDLSTILAQNVNREIRRKPFIGTAGKFEGGHHEHHHEHHHEEHHHAAVHGVATEHAAEGGYDAANAAVQTGGASQTNAAEGHEHAEAPATAPAEQAAPASTAGSTQPGQRQQSSEASVSAPATSSSASPSILSALPDTMCPDGSDALLEDDGKPKLCGSGSDGHQLCPKGYYCSIDSERNSRLCCPFSLQGSNIPPPPAIAPYFGHRRYNPGEVVERGSLPSDPKPPKLSTPKPKTSMTMEDLEATMGEESNAQFNAAGVSGMEDVGKSNYDEADAPGIRPVDETAPIAAGGAHPDVIETEEKPTPLNPAGPAQVQPAHMPTNEGHEEKSPYAHMRLKPFERRNKIHYSRSNDTNAVVDEQQHGQIKTTSQEDPFEIDGESKQIYKDIFDLSMCQLRPSEGRQCREDEPQPLTNLQYFYSMRDKKCKLFFHRGCGGNRNRFDTKSDCEKACSSLMGQ